MKGKWGKKRKKLEKKKENLEKLEKKRTKTGKFSRIRSEKIITGKTEFQRLGKESGRMGN